MASEKARTADAKQCELRLLFLKDLSFESPHVPGVLFGHPQPELKFSVETTYKKRDKDTFEVVLEINVHCTAEDKTLFLIEAKQGGIFEVKGYTSEDTRVLLKTKAPEALFPYARELISSLVSRGGFPRLQLRPLDFDKLYAASLQTGTEE